MKNAFAHEITAGSQITFNEIYPKTVWVSKVETFNNGNQVHINDGEYKFAKYASILIVQ